MVLDNLSSHWVRGIREAIEGGGAECLYLPPCSPDFNSIERTFAEVKGLLRRVAAHTVEGLWQAVAETLDAFSHEECADYFRNEGY